MTISEFRAQANSDRSDHHDEAGHLIEWPKDGETAWCISCQRLVRLPEQDEVQDL